MAINTTKLLPPSKILQSQQKTAPVKKESIGLIIKTKVIKIENLLNRKYVDDIKKQKLKRKETEDKLRSKKENELEKPQSKEDGALKIPDLPKMGFLDRIKNFFIKMLFGFVAIRLLDYLPKLIEFGKICAPVVDFFIDFAGGLLNGLISFVDWGYKAYEATRGFVKKIGGDNAVKKFDAFNNVVGKLIDAAIIAAIAISAIRNDGGFGGEGGKPITGGKPRVTTSGGGGQRRPNIRNPFRQRPTITTSGGKSVLPRGGAIKGGLAALIFLIPDMINSGMLASQGRGKDGLRTFLSAIAGVGAGMLAASAVTAGAAALGVTGVGIPAAIALAVAGFAASSLAGEAAYKIADAGFRKMGLVDTDPETNKPYQYASGGITRGGKATGSIQRTAPKKKISRTLTIQQSPVKPGANVGGEKNIKKIFPEPENKNKNAEVNPLGYMKKSTEIMSSTPFVGPLFNIFGKAQLGQKPLDYDYNSVAKGLSGWIQSLFIGKAYAEGGFVDSSTIDILSDDVALRTAVEKSLEGSISRKVDDSINELMKQLMLKSTGSYLEKTPAEVPGQPGQMSPGSVPGGQLTMEQLVGLAKGAGFSADEAVIMAAIAMGESGGNSNRTNFVPPDKSYGLWQINMIGGLGPARLREFGLSSESQLLDPVTNAKAAYAIRKSQGLSAWTVYKAGIYKNFLAQAQAAKGAPSLATSPVSGTAKGYDDYITGDPSSPNYAPDHGGPGYAERYHDHLSFKDRATAERAYNFFSKRFKVTEFKGFGNGVTGPHSGEGSLHHSGLAFDIPGHQWGGKPGTPAGPIEWRGSAKVRNALAEFKAMAKGGLVGKTKSLQHYPSYDDGGEEPIIIINNIINKQSQRQDKNYGLSSSSGSFGSGYDAFAVLERLPG